MSIRPLGLRTLPIGRVVARSRSILDLGHNPVNREHFWQYTNASQENPTPGLSSPGWSMQDAIAFAKLHNGPLSISETGAGNTSTNPPRLARLTIPTFQSGSTVSYRAPGRVA